MRAGDRVRRNPDMFDCDPGHGMFDLVGEVVRVADGLALVAWDGQVIGTWYAVGHLITVPSPRPFRLVRNEDVSGVSGTGIVAEGVEFRDGTVALRWLSAHPTSVVFHDRGIDSVRAIHGHDGRTRIEFLP